VLLKKNLLSLGKKPVDVTGESKPVVTYISYLSVCPQPPIILEIEIAGCSK